MISAAFSSQSRMRLRSAFFYPTMRQAGGLRRRYPRWRARKDYGATLYRISKRGAPGSPLYRRYHRLHGLHRYRGWSQY